MNEDLKITGNEWADLIDNARDREAVGDLSAIAYRLLGVVVASQLGHHNKAVEIDGAKSGGLHPLELKEAVASLDKSFDL